MRTAFRVPTLLFQLLLAALLFAAGASAQSPASVDVNPVSNGMTVTITGTGFTSKPTVFLTAPGSPKKIAMKVLSFTATQIAAVAPAAPSATYDLHVKIKKTTGDLAAALTLAPPAVDMMTPESAAPKATVTITGTFFGAKKGKILLSGKTAKVSSWTDTSVSFVVPKLAAGPYTAALIAIGGSVTAGTLTVSGAGGGSGGVHFTAKIDGVPFAAEPATLFTVFTQSGVQLYSLTGGHAAPFDEIIVNFSFDVVNGTFPADVSSSTDALVSYVTMDNSNITIWETTVGSQFSIHLTSKSGGHLKGTFSGVVPLKQGTGAASRTITEGEFELLLQ